ncbi:hypothetical protein BCR44DRAFT_148384 [Catenaria anguillulae PL171]|uniref:Sel1 domain protein repeat-containing protein n=1 Tax=Catenaria anguillulae PL171 TaxID=765915 RepID=A0A1Y2HYG8_9FUNG|nr:hypothetical protein BCR44DRAFT_148384 [Catenaria anguillulae PL171]
MAAELYATGVSAFFGDNGKVNYEEALKAFTAASEQGHAEASYALGYMYDHAHGVESDFAKARELYVKSWEAGKVASAAAAIAYLHFEGDGCDVDHTLAKEWFNKASEQLQKDADSGDRHAMYWLANARLDGDLIEEDQSGALELFKKAADAGSVEAMLMAGFIMQENEEYEEAYELYTKAGAKGNGNAMCVLAQFHLEGLGCEQSVDKAVELYNKAFDELKEPAALVGLSALYIDDSVEGITKDVAKSIALLEQAAALGDDDAMMTLASVYSGEVTDDIEEDMTKVLEWYNKAAEKKNTEALNHLAFMYMSGTGVDKDVAKGLELHERAAGFGDSDAMVMLGQIYHSGADGDVDVDLAKAVQFYEKAASRGSGMAMRILAQMYEEGEGVEKNAEKAAEWLEKAEAADDSDLEWGDCCEDEDCEGDCIEEEEETEE